MSPKKIIILGGGYAGVEAARKLAKKFRKQKEVEITLIDKNPFHTLMTELHEVAAARVKPDSVRVSFNRIFSGSKVNVVLDLAAKIDFEKQVLTGEYGDEYSYDYIIIGAGSEPCFFNIPGVDKYSYKLWSYDDALNIRERIDHVFLAASREKDETRRKRLLSFAVAGAGFTGVEMMGELIERKKTLCRKYAIDEKEVTLLIIEGLSSVCNILPEKMQKKTIAYLEKNGVEVHLNSFISKVEEHKISIKDGKELSAGTFIWTAGVKGSCFSENLGLEVHEKDRRPVANSFMQSKSYENVYLAGDNVYFLENNAPIPKIVETAIQTAEVAAHNIAADILGTEKKEFKSNYHGYMVSIGSRYAVAHVGGISLSGFFAMAVKHLVNLHYLFGIAGLNAVWGYLKHEILDIKERRSLIGEMAAYKIPNYWTLPLRVFLGAKWFYEGVKKVAEGWLSPGEGGIFNPALNAIRLPGVRFASVAGSDAVSGASAAVDAAAAATGAAVDAATAATGAAAGSASDAVAAATDAVSSYSSDAVTAATGAADAAADAVAQATGYAASAAADAVAAASDMAGAAGDAAAQYAKPLMEALGAYTWFAENILSASPALAFMAQATVVLAEIAIGLALIGGLFTFLAAGVSILLGFMFIFSGWGNPELLWYIAAAIVMLGGGGRGLGLDHWVMPWIKRWWGGTTLAHKTHLYLDEPVIRNKKK